MPRKNIQALERVAKSSAALLRATITQTMPVVVEFAMPFLIIAGIGLAAVLLRTMIIDAAPYVKEHAKLFAAWATGMNDALAAVGDAVKAIVMLIREAIALLRHRAPPKVPNFVWPKRISVTEVNTFADNLMMCGDVNTTDAIVYITRSAGHKHVCPLLRAASPLRWLNDTIVPAFDWLAFPYEPAPGPNCELPMDYSGTLCAALQSGHIILEVLLPVAFGILLLITASGAVASFVVAIFVTQWRLIVSAIDAVEWL
jgi:hypothetical protein